MDTGRCRRHRGRTVATCRVGDGVAGRRSGRDPARLTGPQDVERCRHDARRLLLSGQRRRTDAGGRRQRKYRPSGRRRPVGHRQYRSGTTRASRHRPFPDHMGRRRGRRHDTHLIHRRFLHRSRLRLHRRALVERLRQRTNGRRRRRRHGSRFHRRGHHLATCTQPHEVDVVLSHVWPRRIRRRGCGRDDHPVGRRRDLVPGCQWTPFDATGHRFRPHRLCGRRRLGSDHPIVGRSPPGETTPASPSRRGGGSWPRPPGG